MENFARIARIGERQHDVWSREQALACGFPSSTIDHLVARGIWRRWFDGPVFGPTGARPDWRSSITAAWLRVAPLGGVVARRSAARLWHLPGFDTVEALELVVPRDHTPSIRGLAISRSIHLPPCDVVAHGVLAVTSVTRTLHDLAAVSTDEKLLVAAAEGLRLRRTEPWKLLASLHARPGLAGNARLRRVIEQLDARFARTRSVAEIVGQVRLRDLGYHDYEVNVPLVLTSGRAVEVDILFPLRGVLEINGARYHGTVLQRRGDADRRRDLEADGYVVRELWAHELPRVARVREVVEELQRAANP